MSEPEPAQSTADRTHFIASLLSGGTTVEQRLQATEMLRQDIQLSLGVTVHPLEIFAAVAWILDEVQTGDFPPPAMMTDDELVDAMVFVVMQKNFADVVNTLISMGATPTGADLNEDNRAITSMTVIVQSVDDPNALPEVTVMHVPFTTEDPVEILERDLRALDAYKGLI